MTHTSKTIVFFGTDPFSAVSLRALIEHGFSIAAVVTKPDSRKGRGREMAMPLVKEIALEHNITVLQPNKLDEIYEELKKLEHPTGVLVSYGKIIPQSIIDLFEPGIINVHPSLLPKYRGPSPVETAILQGDTETGVTIMQLSAAMDAGPIYKQVIIPLTDTETAPQLEEQLAEIGAWELVNTLPSIINGSRIPTPQDETLATYCKLLKKEDSFLNPSEVTAEQAERQVRAFLAYPKTKVTVNGHDIVITAAHIASSGSSVLDIICKDGQYLCIDTLMGPSGRAMDAKAFLNGYGA